MSMPDFPTYMQPKLDGYNISFEDNRLEAQVESGHKKTRGRSCRTYKTIKLNFYCCKDHLMEFEDWYKNETLFGAKRFCFIDPCTSKAEIARFTEMPSMSPVSDLCLEEWEVSISVEVECFAENN